MFPFIPTVGSGSNYTINRSLRFRSSASAYLNRTPASAGSQTTWTMSMWVKRGALGARQFITMSGVNPNSSQVWQVEFDANNKLDFYNQTINTYRRTTQVFRDVGAWYHIVFGADTNNAIAQNRFRCWVNGVEVTAWDVNSTISSGYSFAYNGAYLHGIGAYTYSGNGLPLDGYLTEINFIDGQALTPSSFGTFNATTGVWQPAKYTGSYGTNGFYLPFTNNASTTTLGNDFSPNGNNWTTNNISLTAGSTYDSMTDVPTLTSATAGNYAVWNPLYKGSNITAINGNLQTSWTSNGNVHETIAATIAVNSGKWYWEITKNDTRTDSESIGIIRSDVTQSNMNGQMGYGQSASPSYSWSVEGNKYKNSASGGAYGAAWTTNGDIIGVALDLSTNPGTITMYKNGVSQGTMYSDISTSFSWIPAVSGYGSGTTSSFIANFGQRPFTYTPPSGFVALNTFNLPAPTISNGAAHMAATTYVGDGANPRTITNTVNGVSLQPDLVWIKARSNTYDHTLYDSIRGATNYLISNSTATEGSAANTLQAFNSNGFQVGGSNSTNSGSVTYVGWQWKANGAAVTNTAGSITSQVSANTAAGFSVVTYTEGGTYTVGHGLGVAPSMIILKERNASGNWIVWTNYWTAPTRNGLYLNGSQGIFTTGSNWLNSTTSTVFGITSGQVTSGSAQIVAYCFAAVPGYSAFGSYTGNGSTDGPFVYLGFRPRFVMFKRTDSTGSWFMEDSSRGTYNVMGPELYANNSDSEANVNRLDFLSNGFKMRAGNPGDNASGGTYIYACFAESPFKTSLAR